MSPQLEKPTFAQLTAIVDEVLAKSQHRAQVIAIMDELLDKAQQLDSIMASIRASAGHQPHKPAESLGPAGPALSLQARVAHGHQLCRDLHDMAMKLSPDLCGPKSETQVAWWQR